MRAIRPAAPSDIPGIARVCEAAFAESIDPEVCLRQIADPTIDLHVAVEGSEIAGFVSAFALDGATDNPWFVDSLAVHPQSQGRGYGRHLIESTWTTARRRGFRLSRALVRADNAPSQRCFAHCGYATDQRSHSLYIWPPQASAANGKTDPVRLLPVDTITYRGLWLEGLADTSASACRATSPRLLRPGGSRPQRCPDRRSVPSGRCIARSSRIKGRVPLVDDNALTASSPSPARPLFG